MSCHFIFCLHNHQPVGNFDHIFDWAYTDCYNKALDILDQYPEFRFAVHHSGPLLEWIERHRPVYFEKLKRMIDRGQVEIIGGGFYEPIFSIISVADIHRQIDRMQEFCRSRFSVTPTGFWTAERVWDPEIPHLVNQHNLQYTFLDDNHFRYAGIEEDQLYGYYLTERLSYPLRVFPIDRFLRYAIPFKSPQECVDYFAGRTEKNPGSAFVYGDDGEKFGVWRGTYDWVYTRRWLVDFIETILKNPWISMTHPADYIASNPPIGRVYLTQGSYFELSEWALPVKSAVKFHAINNEVKQWGRGDEFYPYLKGGVWNNFLNKYPESNAINKRTLLLSDEINRLKRENGGRESSAETDLYKSECNCAYWHGVFGGIYLNNLRHALYHHLLLSEGKLLREQGITGCRIIRSDFWLEGHDQILVRTPLQSVIAHPEHGGSLSELGLYGPGYNVFNTIARRPEAYHEVLRDVDRHQVPETDNGSAHSIHDMVIVKEKDLHLHLNYDQGRRYSFKDYFADSLPSAADLMTRQMKLHDLGNTPYACSPDPVTADARIRMHRICTVSNRDISLEKVFVIDPAKKGVLARYRISGASGLFFGTELNINLQGDNDPDRYYVIDGIGRDASLLGSSGSTSGLTTFSMHSDPDSLVVRLSSSVPATLVRYPIYTVSQSDSGFEKNYQGSSLLFWYEIIGEIFEVDIDLGLDIA